MQYAIKMRQRQPQATKKMVAKMAAKLLFMGDSAIVT